MTGIVLHTAHRPYLVYSGLAPNPNTTSGVAPNTTTIHVNVGDKTYDVKLAQQTSQAGIDNLDSQCYFNASIHILYSIPEIRLRVLQHTILQSSDAPWKHLQDIFKHMDLTMRIDDHPPYEKTRDNIIAQILIKKLCPLRVPNEVHMQHDPHEKVLMWAIDEFGNDDFFCETTYISNYLMVFDLNRPFNDYIKSMDPQVTKISKYLIVFAPPHPPNKRPDLIMPEEIILCGKRLQLHGALLRKGSEAKSGHYVAVLKNGDGYVLYNDIHRSETLQWDEIDDTEGFGTEGLFISEFIAEHMYLCVYRVIGDAPSAEAAGRSSGGQALPSKPSKPSTGRASRRRKG